MAPETLAALLHESVRDLEHQREKLLRLSGVRIQLLPRVQGGVMAFKTSVLKTETQIIVTLAPSDGVDKTDIDALKGCSAAKLDVNGVLKFTVERPKRPLRADIVGEGNDTGGAE